MSQVYGRRFGVIEVLFKIMSRVSRQNRTFRVLSSGYSLCQLVLALDSVLGVKKCASTVQDQECLRLCV